MAEYYFSHMSKREIPVFCEDFAYGERLYGSEPGYTFYECPVTGENIIAQEHPEELLVYYDNLDGGITHLNENYQSIYDEYIETEYASDSDFIAYLVDRLPAEMPLYHLIISHPQGVSGDFVELLYKGVYDREWIPICDDDVEFEEEEEEVIETPLHSKDDVLAAIEKNGGTVNANLNDFCLTGIDLSGIDLRGVNLENAKLTKVNLANANLEGAILCKVHFDGIVLTGASLKGANLSEAYMGNVKLDSADISDVDFRKANMHHMNLTNANATNSNFNAASLCYSSVEMADFTGADMSSTDLTNCEFSGANFSDCNIQYADVSHSNFTNAKLNNTKLNNIYNFFMTNFTDACMIGVDLSNSEPIDTIFRNANLTNANLSSTYLAASDIQGANLTGADVTDAIFKNIDLSNTILTDVDMSKAKIK
jgi:uncharacterized protein YjbI with pentapeptide repeats